MSIASIARARQDDDLLQAVEAVLPVLRKNARQTEIERRVVSENIEAVRDAGVFRMCIPKKFGGLESDILTQFEVLQALGRGCGSTAWITQAYLSGSWMSAMFPLAVQEEVFSDQDVRVAGLFSPTITMTHTDGGYLLNGRGAFNSGGPDAHWNVLAALDPANPSQACLMLVPMSDLQMVDDWHVSGLCGTASRTVVAENAFIPAQRALPMSPILRGEHVGEHPHSTLYRYAAVPLFMTWLCGAPLGMAQGALESFITERLPGRRFCFDSQALQSESPLTHVHVAEAKMKVELARMLVERYGGVVHARAETGEGLTAPERVAIRAEAAYAMRLTRDVADLIASISGGSATYLHVPIQRHLRDIMTASNHAYGDYDAGMALYGRTLVGLEPDSPFL